jgi:hypothetical protein
MAVSGIITTNLGKTATFSRVAGRERRVHHSKSLPLLLTEERFFLSSRSYFFPATVVFVFNLIPL